MPELPEVETMRRGVLPIVGSRITAIDRPKCLLKPIELKPRIDLLRRRTVGQQIVEIGRVGKRVIVRLASEHRLVFEPRMTGLVLLADPPNTEHLRLRVALAGGPAPELLFWDRRGLGSVRLLSPAEFTERLGETQLGPDALAVTPELYRQRLAPSKRAIKVALLDQRAVAGIGNLYASEILHTCGIHPERTCDSLKPAEWSALTSATQEVLLLAIQHEGSTLSDGTYRNALNEPGGYQNHHRVYDRAGRVCSSCGKAEVVRIVQAQRSTFFCPQCQPKGRRRKRK